MAGATAAGATDAGAAVGSPASGPVTAPGGPVAAARSRTIPAMDQRTFDTRELLITTVLLVGLSRLVEPPLIWLVAVLVLVVVAVAALQLLALVDPAGETAGVPIESLLVPAAAAVAVAGAIRLIPVGLWLLPALAAGGLLLGRTLRTEAEILGSPTGDASWARRSVMGGILVVAFVGFLGVAATVPGGLPDPTGALFASSGIRLRNLALLAGADGVIAALLAYRAAALRGTNLREVAWSALTAGVAVAIAAAGLRAMALPRLLGPALLVIVFYLWDSIHATVRSDQRDVRRIWEAILLSVAALVVIAWSFNAPAS